MASETTVNNINRFSGTIVLLGIVLLGLIGMVNLFNDYIGKGLGFIVTSIILLRLFVWIEKIKLRSGRG